MKVKLELYGASRDLSEKNLVYKHLRLFESFFSNTSMLLLETKLKRAGNKVNVIIKDVIKPNVIIQPKSIIGFFSLKIRDKKAQIVVKTV